ncbi:hypothetical protein J4Q44_G00240220 [Coregonus suidteri]|uniref:Uncharacterized protein n=1 Tax=Coregonus suidteri TaxID=861788 RepID=A0AAN8QXP0_9TELE
MPCITPGKKTLQFAQLAIGSTIGITYPMAIGSTYPKSNIWTIVAPTATRMHFHARLRTSYLSL